MNDLLKPALHGQGGGSRQRGQDLETEASCGDVRGPFQVGLCPQPVYLHCCGSFRVTSVSTPTTPADRPDQASTACVLDTQLSSELKQERTSPSQKAVMDLRDARDFFWKSYHAYIDNWYTSTLPFLFHFLQSKKTGAVGKVCETYKMYMTIYIVINGDVYDCFLFSFL